jgi:hypothetical protein
LGEFPHIDPRFKQDIHILLIFYCNMKSLKFPPVLRLMAWNMLSLAVEF